MAVATDADDGLGFAEQRLGDVLPSNPRCILAPGGEQKISISVYIN
jgi:hypothetical protein